ncbi:MAG: GDP-L-fucose synthase [Rhizomicrobium sp.]
MTALPLSLEGKRIWVAGHRGMVGSAIVRRLAREDCEVLTVSRAEVDLRRQDQVEQWMGRTRPDVVVLAAAKVGGILANATSQADFLYDNLMIEANVIRTAHSVGVRKLLALGSSCIYPRLATQPIREDSLLTGPLEPTNEGYAIAKIAGIKLCEMLRRQYGADFISVMPPNLYGQGDNFDPQTSHVLSALMHKIHVAKTRGDSEVDVWGSGNVFREFMYVDDLADACIFLLRNYSDGRLINAGSQSDLTIRALAAVIADVIGYTGAFRFDLSKPDGMPRKLMDSSRIAELGWAPRIDLRAGIAATYAWYTANLATAGGERIAAPLEAVGAAT